MNLHAPVMDPIVTADYGFRVTSGQKQFHNGINYVSRSGDTRVFAIADGILIRDIDGCRPVLEHMHRSPWSGNFVAIEHHIGSSRYYGIYVHLLENTHPHGQTVHAGFELGRYAEAHSDVTGPYLHLTILNETGDAIDPASLLERSGIPARSTVAVA